jgi:hypothetical protein
MVYGSNDFEFYILKYMKNYYPYPANDGKHKYYKISKSGRKIYSGLLVTVISPSIRTRTGNSDL